MSKIEETIIEWLSANQTGTPYESIVEYCIDFVGGDMRESRMLIRNAVARLSRQDKIHKIADLWIIGPDPNPKDQPEDRGKIDGISITLYLPPRIIANVQSLRFCIGDPRVPTNWLPVLITGSVTVIVAKEAPPNFPATGIVYRGVSGYEIKHLSNGKLASIQDDSLTGFGLNLYIYLK